MCKHHLKLNGDKTEFVVISSKPVSKKFTTPSINIDNHIITSSLKAKNIGVIMDSHMSMEAHISSVCKSAYMHIRNIGKLRKYLDQDSLETIIHAFITSKLDYCNSLLCGVASTQLNRLQRIQNVAARILTGHPKRDHITPVLFSLHWLPVVERIKFKVLTMVHKAIYDKGPAYLQDLLIKHKPGRKLRSGDKNLLSVPFTKSSLVQNCAFSAAGPKLWNELPDNLRSMSNFTQFKKHLKTHLFTSYFNCYTL